MEPNILPENNLHSSGKEVMSLPLKKNNYKLLETYTKVKNIFSVFQIFKWVLTYLFATPPKNKQKTLKKQKLKSFENYLN